MPLDKLDIFSMKKVVGQIQHHYSTFAMSKVLYIEDNIKSAPTQPICVR